MDERGAASDLPPVSGAGGAEAAGAAGSSPQVAGYDVTGRLGEGGMGTVWRAVQQSTHREVALKVLSRAAIGSQRARLRFDREVELAARLEHPHIARVYDSGVHQGVCYYAMELVDGLPLDDYVQQHDLRPRQVLDLVRAACRAVQHAHQRGVIHRDLKPSNILVTEDGQPHVLDFGLAKAFLEPDAGVTVSLDGEVAGTPAYMSPEQAAGRTDEIDTRSDVYSLGVVLYWLLTGHPPHAISGTRYEVLRRIAEEEVRRPRQVGSRLDRELETLLLKALAQEPDQRYASAGELADDIDNYLTGEPLTAKAPTTIYFLRKRVSKYRGRVAVAALVVVALVAMAVWSHIRVAEERDRAVVAEQDALAARDETAQERDRAVGAEKEAAHQRDLAVKARDEAQQEAAKAQAVTQFLQDTLSSVDPAEARGREVTVREMFDKASETVGQKFADQPLVEAALRHTLGGTYLNLGYPSAAQAHLSRALEIARTALGEQHLETLAAKSGLANALMAQGRDVEAEQLLRQVVDVYEKASNRHPLWQMNLLGKCLCNQGRYAEAAGQFRQVLEIGGTVLPEEHPTMLAATTNLSMALRRQGKFAEAEVLGRKALAASERALGQDHPQTLICMQSLGNVLGGQGKYADAEKLARQVLEIRQRVLGDDHPSTLGTMNNLALVLQSQGKHSEAGQLHRQVLEIRRRVLGEEHPDVLVSMRQIAVILRDQRKYEEAEALTRRVLQAQRRLLGDEHPDVLASMRNVAGILRHRRKYEEAEALMRQVLEARRRLWGDEHIDTLGAMNDLASNLDSQKKFDEAERLHRQVLESRRRLLGEKHPETIRSMYNVAVVLSHKAEYAEAERLFRHTLDGRRRILGEQHPLTLKTMVALAAMLQAQGKNDEATALRDEVRQIEQRLEETRQDRKAVDKPARPPKASGPSKP